METLPEGTLRFIPLGGVGEIGKNMYAYQVRDQILIVDCGLKFPDDDMFGVDVVVPDVRWLAENKDAVQGIVITHGHEDHIGGLAYILPQLPDVPVYGSKLALGLAKGRLSERKVLSQTTLREFAPDDIMSIGAFTVEPIRVAHSIPDSFALAIRTPAGTVIHTGDFKFDQTPVDGLLFDVAKLSRISEEGVLALVSDTTNVERPGFVPSEQIVAQTFDRIIREAPGRVIIASFASQIHRMQMAVNSAQKYGRKVAAIGRSLQNNFEFAGSSGYLTVPEGIRVRAEDIGSVRAAELVVLTTGSQGEPLAGLSRMANDDHRQVRIQENDTIILSASPIPGNEDAVWRVVNRLIEKGANVIYDTLMPVHVSGHGYSEELKLVLNIVNPRYAIPVHGEARMLRRYAAIAQEMGWRKEDVFQTQIGDVLEMTEAEGKVVDRIPSGAVLVDAGGSGAIHEVVLRDRQHLAEEGFVVVVVGLNRETGEITTGPEILSRGFVYMDHSEELINEATDAVRDYFAGFPAGSARETDAVQGDLRQLLKKLFERRTGRRPLVLPMVMEL